MFMQSLVGGGICQGFINENSKKAKKGLLSEVINNLISESSDDRYLESKDWTDPLYTVERVGKKARFEEIKYGLEQINLGSLAKITKEIYTIYDIFDETNRFDLLIGKKWAFFINMSKQDSNPFRVQYALRREGEDMVSVGVLRDTFDAKGRCYSIHGESNFKLSQREDIEEIFGRIGIDYNCDDSHHEDICQSVYFGRVLAGLKLK